MDTKLQHTLQELRNAVVTYEISRELTVSQLEPLKKVVTDIDIAVGRLAVIEVETEPSCHFPKILEELSEATATLKSSLSIKEAQRAISQANEVLNFVVAHVEPDEPWPRK